VKPYSILGKVKLTVSLSDNMAGRLAACAREQAGGNASAVVEVALRQFFDLPAKEIGSLLTRFRMDRKATTRSGWARAFWYVLGQLMNQPDFIGNVYAPRNFGGFYAVLLFNRVGCADEEDDPFLPYIGPLPILPNSPAPQPFHFERAHSPVAAAQVVAAKLREFGAPVRLLNPEID
jgi:hypothetical protein